CPSFDDLAPDQLAEADLIFLFIGGIPQQALLIKVGALLERVGNASVIPVVEYAEQEKRSEEHTSELQSRENLVCGLLLEKKKGGTRSQALRGDSSGGGNGARRDPNRTASDLVHAGGREYAGPGSDPRRAAASGDPGGRAG